jgi:D-sedoheptulose 7-phosphate isomerase
MKSLIRMNIEENIKIMKSLLHEWNGIKIIEDLAILAKGVISDGNHIYLCGNGGSASCAQHLASELVGRFTKERPPYSAIALSNDISVITSIANDFGFEYVFSRQIEAHFKKNDLLIVLSTSGRSENVYRAILSAKKKGGKTAAFLGEARGKLGDTVDFPIITPSSITARIQETHILLGHILCELIENLL